MPGWISWWGWGNYGAPGEILRVADVLGLVDPRPEAKKRKAVPAKCFSCLLPRFFLRVRENALQNEIARPSVGCSLHWGNCERCLVIGTDGGSCDRHMNHRL
jgi:hypothetical protein